MGTILPERFEPIRLLRKDRASSTFVATDRGLGRNEVVVKIVGRGNFAPDTAALVDVFSWYRGLRHVFISEILDAGLTPKKDLFYVRAYHPPSEFFTSANTASVKALVSAVDFLCSMRRIHGSIKPTNVFAVGGSVKIADPWVGQNRTDPKWPLTEEDIRFSAPEVLSGGAITVDSDLYSLGALLYRFYSGRDPFEDSDLESLKAKYTWASPRSLISVSHVSKQIGEIVSNLLNKDPSLRIAAFETLKDELGVEPTSASRAPAVGLSGAVEKTLAHLVEKPRLRMALVEGPAGHGKSRFVEELQNRASLQGYMLIGTEPTAQDPYVTFARRLVSVIDERPFATGAASLSRLRTVAETEFQARSKPQQEEIERDLVSVLASIGRQARLLLAIEDIDRGGRKLTGLIESLVQQLSDLELAIVVTARPGGVSARAIRAFSEFLGEDFCSLTLGLLSREDSAILSSFLTHERQRRNHAEHKASGNPCFLEEYCSYDQNKVPKRVRKALTSMILRLPTHTRRAAEILSLFDQPIDLDVLSEVSSIGKENLAGSVFHLERLGLVEANHLSIRYPDAKPLFQSRIPKARRIELHARCFRCLKEVGCKDGILADHAFHGCLFSVAATLYLRLAGDSFVAKDYRNAGRYYDLVIGCSKVNSEVAPLDPPANVNLARCCALQGNKRRAKEILRHLLESETVREDSELLSSIYAALASPVMEDAAEERVRLLGLAIRCLSEDSSQMIHRYRALAIVFLSMGKLAQAEGVRKKIEFYCKSSEDLAQLEDISASIFMSQGNFKEAISCLLNKQFAWSTPGGVMNNLAVCVEQLGDLKRARQLQTTALREAEESGTFWVQVMSLGNLGSMETKLGNFVAAEALFGSAIRKLRELERRNGQVATGNFGMIYADAAAYLTQRGQFRRAIEYVGRIKPAFTGPLSVEIFLIAITRLELHIALGQLQKAREILTDPTVRKVNGDFFEVERLLLESRLEKATVELSVRLEHALAICERLGTLYLECRVRLALARVLVSLGDLKSAEKAAKTARRVAEEHGYKTLGLRALLLIGLAADRDTEKEFALKKSLEEAAEMDLTPLAAECAFHLGSWRFACGDFADAREYLSKSVSIMTRLAEDLSRADRTSYFSNPDFRRARELLSEVSGRALSAPSRKLPELLDKESAFFARLYRLTAAMTAAPDVPSAMATLLDALRESMTHLVVIVSGVGGTVTFQAIRTSMSEEIGKRVVTIAASAGDKPYITGIGTTHQRDMAVWVPILSCALRGGIYVQCLPDQSPLEEREIEFLAVVAAIAATALDHLSSKIGRPTVPSSSQFHEIVGSSKQMRQLRNNIEMAGTNAATVLIEGESGTGKELVAKAIHLESRRSKGPFVPVDCGALPEGLVEAELFGAKKGAYTGAVTERRGLFEAANSGTIFLDEISNLGLAEQAKLLRVLQERQVRMIGSMTGKPVDVRLIAATNCNLERLVRDGRFREDLLYRLKVLHIVLPPLRDRKDDIPLLAATFLERLNLSNQSNKYFGPRVVGKLLEHDYPGNVRELQNAVERAFYSTASAVIAEIDFAHEGGLIDSHKQNQNETADWFKKLTEGRENFWSAVHDRYKRRDISRDKVVALVDFGLRTTRGNYKTMASMFQIPQEEYHRFMDFLRRSQCLLDFRPYRRIDRITD